ncbi:hypothetical protein SAMN03159489_03354 [Pseudomonas sp. NFPP07]|nr:hypothetical protein SAMN03159489_03354 [Pseudomonas sp. NFPP07]
MKEITFLKSNQITSRLLKDYSCLFLKSIDFSMACEVMAGKITDVTLFEDPQY